MIACLQIETHKLCPWMLEMKNSKCFIETWDETTNKIFIEIQSFQDKYRSKINSCLIGQLLWSNSGDLTPGTIAMTASLRIKGWTEQTLKKFERRI